MSRSSVAGAGRDDLARYLECLFGLVIEPRLIEVRRRVPSGMASTFVTTSELEHAAACILEHGAATDVFIGVAPRVRPRGCREDVEMLHAVWADCDTEESMERLRAFHPRPSMVVGSGRGRHAYWLLAQRV